MKPPFAFFACIIVIILAAAPGVCWSQEIANGDATAEPRGNTANDDQIRALREGLLTAVTEKDVDALLTYLHEDIVLTTQDGVKLVTIRKHAGVRDYMDRLLTGKEPAIKSVRPNVDVEELVIMHGDEIGTAFGSSDDHYVLSTGGDFDLATRWSATLVREGNAWKVANLHISSNIFDNPIFNAAKNSLYRVGGIAFSLGVLIGLLLAKLSSLRTA